MNKQQQIIKQHNVITQARYSLSATELDIFFALLSKIGDEKASKDFYVVDVNWLEQLSGVKFNSTQLRHTTETMIKRIYTLTEDDGSYTQVALLSSVRYIAKERKLILRVAPEMEEYLFDLKKNFTLYYLEYALKLNSKFSKRLYQMLSQFRSTGLFKTSLKQLKEQLGLIDEETGKEQYGKLSAFKRYVLDVAQEELESTDMPFTYKLIKKGLAYQGIEFHFEPLGLDGRPVAADCLVGAGETEEAVEEAKARVEARLLHPEEVVHEGVRTLYERMTDDFDLAHEQIAEIFDGFKIKAIHKALYDIKLLISDGKVSNKKAYTMKFFANLK